MTDVFDDCNCAGRNFSVQCPDRLEDSARTFARRTGIGASGVWYNDFDIIFSPVFAHFVAPPHPIRDVCYALLRARADRVLIGAWNPTL